MPVDARIPVLLVVDDEPVNIEILNEILQDDYKILFATNGLDALEVAAAQKPDLILLDVMMPELDGREVCLRMKADARLQEIPIIFISALSGQEDEVVGLEVGAVDYITKPVNPEIVRLRVKTHLELKQHRDRLEELVQVRTAELMRAHDAARERESLLWTVLSSSLDPFIMMDAQGLVVEFNPAAEQLFGYRRDQVLGKELAAFIVPMEWREQHRRALTQVGSFSDNRRFKTDGLRSDGKIVDLEIAVSTVLAHGQPLYTAFLRDITSTKQLLFSLGSALDTAESAFRAKDLFLANMSHEIRTPMNGVLGMVDLALGLELPAKAREYLSHAKASSQILLRVINDILDFSKIESGKLQIDSVEFYLGDLLADAVNMFRHASMNKDLELVVAAPPRSIGLLVGDRLRIQQILINLLSNAIKFTKEGDICLKVVPVEQTKETVRLEFSVRDSGIGLSEAQMERLFSPFVQADSSTTRHFGGTGLGLAICKRLVEMMGGEIWVTSTPNAGSCFYFTVVVGHSHRVAPYHPDMPDDMKGMQVLVVDDHADVREVTTSILQQMGMAVVAVESGQQALDVLQAAAHQHAPYALVLLDWRMPEMDGVETARRIFSEEKDSSQKKPKVIMMTAFGKEDLIQQVRRMGVDGCLIKPITPSLLLDTILDIFGKTTSDSYGLDGGETDRVALVRWLGGAPILLVEDNPINQRVAREILESIGIVVTVANDGQEAIHKVLNGSFALVLMDVQMPVMDGYQATKRLREMEAFKALPIIAMTAHALTGDRENCLNAGMSDYVSKPIDFKQLFNVLTRWIKPQDNGVDPALLLARSVEKEESQRDDGDLPGIHMQAAMAGLCASRAFYEQILLDFARDYSQVAEEIRTALFVRDDLASGQLQIHSIKGVAGNIGARALQAAASHLEESVVGGRRAEWVHLLERFERAMAQVLQSVALLEKEREPPAQPSPISPEEQGRAVDWDAVMQHVTAMTKQLESGNIQASQHLEPLNRLLAGQPFQRELANLAWEVEQFSFDVACLHLEKIANKINILKGNLDV